MSTVKVVIDSFFACLALAKAISFQDRHKVGILLLLYFISENRTLFLKLNNGQK